MISFLKAALKAAAAFFFALLGILIVVWLYNSGKDAYEKQQEKPYEAVKTWEVNLKNELGILVQARTKLIAGKLMISTEVDGYPKYFSDPRNKDGSLIIEFYDKDGFKVISETIKLNEFTTLVDSKSNEAGLQAQVEDYIDVERYKRFYQFKVGWNLITSPPKLKENIAKPQILDHCAMSLTKIERIKRLSQYGEVRETGAGSYSASGHSMSFSTYDGSLIYCH